MDRFITITFCFLVVSHSFGLPRASRVVAESVNLHAKSTTRMNPNNISEAYTSPASFQSENPVGMSESDTTTTTYSDGSFPTILPDTTLAASNETLSPTRDGPSDFTNLDNTTSADEHLSTKSIPTNSTYVVVSSENPMEESSSEKNVMLHPWMKLSRITREREMAQSKMTDSNNNDGLKEGDMEHVTFVTEGLSAIVSQSVEEELKDRSNASESSDTEDTRDDKSAENLVESLGSGEDRFGAVYPYLYRQQFLRERFWPIYRKHPYNSYIRYPIFPGK